MKINVILVTSILIVCTFFSCSNEKAYEPIVYKDVSLSLNDEQKWSVPSQMKIYMDSSFILIDQLEHGEIDLLEIRDDLVDHKNGFVSNCTMKGAGHDVLHDWLIPYLGILDMLSEVDSAYEIEQVKAELIEAKRLYLEFFN